MAARNINTVVTAMEQTRKRRRLGHATPQRLPFLVDGSGSEGDLCSRIVAVFEKYQVAYISAIERKNETSLSSIDIEKVFDSLCEKDKQSWCVENADGNPSPSSFLSCAASHETSQLKAYCSFLIQHDRSAYEKTVKRLPVEDVFGESGFAYEPCLWVFFGRNPSTEDMQGRPEHTDSIENEGTWHYQLCGVKKWFLRPTVQLLDVLEQTKATDAVGWSNATRFEICCCEGDILIVNTKLWFHQTSIPPQSAPSISYARDFWCPGRRPDSIVATMSNVDGLYATEEIDEGTIIFKETDMPDCSLHRSNTNPNCEIVELDDGTSAVIACRTIAPGEFFCVQDSSDEEDYSVNDDDDSDTGDLR